MALIHEPDLSLWTPRMASGYKWLVSDTDLWGSEWSEGVNLFMELQQLSGFPVSCFLLILWLLLTKVLHLYRRQAEIQHYRLTSAFALEK